MGRGLSAIGRKRDCVEDRSGLEKFRAEINIVACGGGEGMTGLVAGVDGEGVAGCFVRILQEGGAMEKWTWRGGGRGS